MMLGLMIHAWFNRFVVCSQTQILGGITMVPLASLFCMRYGQRHRVTKNNYIQELAERTNAERRCRCSGRFSLYSVLLNVFLHFDPTNKTKEI